MNCPSASPAEYSDLWHNPRLARWAGWAVIVLAALLYLATLDTGLRPDELSGGDLITHQYAQVQARPSNAPGYPLYTMGGWLWFHLTGPPVRAGRSTRCSACRAIRRCGRCWPCLSCTG